MYKSMAGKGKRREIKFTKRDRESVQLRSGKCGLHLAVPRILQHCAVGRVGGNEVWQNLRYQFLLQHIPV